MSKIVINITHKNDEIVKIHSECTPLIAYEMIKNMAKDHDVEVYINSKRLSLAVLIALREEQKS